MYFNVNNEVLQILFHLDQKFFHLRQGFDYLDFLVGVLVVLELLACALEGKAAFLCQEMDAA